MIELRHDPDQVRWTLHALGVFILLLFGAGMWALLRAEDRDAAARAETRSSDTEASAHGDDGEMRP